MRFTFLILCLVIVHVAPAQADPNLQMGLELGNRGSALTGAIVNFGPDRFEGGFITYELGFVKRDGSNYPMSQGGVPPLNPGEKHEIKVQLNPQRYPEGTRRSVYLQLKPAKYAYILADGLLRTNFVVGPHPAEKKFDLVVLSAGTSGNKVFADVGNNGPDEYPGGHPVQLQMNGRNYESMLPTIPPAIAYRMEFNAPVPGTGQLDAVIEILGLGAKDPNLNNNKLQIKPPPTPVEVRPYDLGIESIEFSSDKKTSGLGFSYFEELWYVTVKNYGNTPSPKGRVLSVANVEKAPYIRALARNLYGEEAEQDSDIAVPLHPIRLPVIQPGEREVARWKLPNGMFLKDTLRATLERDERDTNPDNDEIARQPSPVPR